MGSVPSSGDAATDTGLRAAIEGGDIAVLLAVLTQYTGDTSLLDRCRPFIKGPWDYLVEMPADLDREIRNKLSAVLARGCAPSAIPPQLVEQIMSTIVGEAVPSEYVNMLAQDLHVCVKAPSKQSVGFSPFKVVVIGAGISGICAAIRLKEAGIAFEVLERNEQLGGTWYENKYPGCGVDTPNHFYSYSFELNDRWTKYFAKRDEIFEYLNAVAAKYGILSDIQFKTSVQEADYDDAANEWILSVRGADGVAVEKRANAVIFAVGGLNRPAWPSIPEFERFTGPKLHTAAWDTSVSLRGKRVSIVGTGASAMQAAPEIAKVADRLTIYQRSPQWVSPNPNYLREVSSGKQLALRHIPSYARWYRFQLFWGGADAVHPSLVVDPAWPHQDRSLNAKNEEMRVRLTAHIKKTLETRPELWPKVTPTYPPYGKRMLRDNNWYDTLLRNNVELVVDPISRVTERGLIAGDVERPADILVCATGFQTHNALAPIQIRGRQGKNIREVWGEDDPRAYLGVTVPGFPNMFILFGPNTILAHGGSAVFQSEAQVNYTVQALRALISGGYSAMECRQDAHDAYNARVDEQHAKMVWAHPGVNNWYRNRSGRVTMASPWRMVDYWAWLEKLQEHDYIWTRRARGAYSTKAPVCNSAKGNNGKPPE
jgi:4-hydroxyacetophenone monooxygenase